MQLLFKLIALVFFVLVMILLAVGLLSDFTTEFSASTTVDNPKNISWKKIIDYGEYPKWLFQGATIIAMDSEPLQRNSILAVYPPAGNQKISTEYRITEFVTEKRITWRNIGSNQLPLINDHTISIELQSLRDGSSEIIWHESYRVTTLFSKIYNALIYVHYRTSKARDCLRQLKRLIENY
jgi:uncharacterized membrane protein